MKTFSLFLYLVLLFFGCDQPQKKKEVTSWSGTAMTMEYRIIVGKQLSFSEKGKAKAICAATFEEVDRVYNKWNPHSHLSKLNQLSAHTPLTIPQGLEECFDLVDEMVALTEGRFDPTIETLQQLWKQQLSMGQVPSSEETEELFPTLGWHTIVRTKTGVYKTNGKTALDLGGIAKGHCVDLILERLVAAGFPDLYVEWGGEIRASGVHPEGRPWTVTISNLGSSSPSDSLDTVLLKDQAIATSGDYFQQWTAQGTDYCHIFDPRSGIPLLITPDSIASVSVLAPTCALADALATAAMTFPDEKELSRWIQEVQKKFPETTFWIVTRREAT